MKKPPAQLRFVMVILTVLSSLPLSFVYAQSPEVEAEWALFNQILIIGIIVGIVVFGLMFYAIIRYRDRPQKVSGK
ncbi:MAG TPA: cytochrome c oxidase subunit II transmembrane domain-containing protein [Candidatus Acidoferrales bacterium]|nr:cytochrome c oxidase subunit II transmembrane domain-containing protein [Candidatus Acidoferrales bacterium]